MNDQRRRWPSQAALDTAIAAVKKACGEVGGVRVHADGSFDVFSPAGAAHLADEAESAIIAEKIRKAGA